MSVEHHHNHHVSDTEMCPPQPGVSRLEDGQKVRQLLVRISKAFQTTQAQFAELLVECHDKSYWGPDYRTFQEYVACELGLKQRKTQELMKVWRVCQQFEIPPEEINKLGWSKLAIVASSINAGNVHDVLKNVTDKTYAELQSEQKRHRRKPSAKKKADAKIVMTDVIQQALRLAASRLHDVDTQECLESIAKHYLQSVSFRSRLPRRDERN